ncbi:ATP-binding protein [Inquilinus sp. Marseille-Q2685]|uniref:ATP-binding protein n=1 Tax=Inquilinus sp. Marseille-Q2685 TaxID=2866581 RepID=UPI001CE49A51|nr:ATP-binding protein [Inquilinus sp. Marseille-Q2685]
MAQQEVLFDQRFLDKHAGAIISDPAVAIVELVANAWDAYASAVEITWPNRKSGTQFSIADNGKGMTAQMFERRWRKLDYNRIAEEGGTVTPPTELEEFPPRKAYGRNGRGRHAAFRFSDPYTVRTWRDGIEVTFEVRRGTTSPFEIMLLNKREGVDGHGTVISATSISDGVAMSAEEAREVLGTRFLADPNFRVSVDSVVVTFDDVPRLRLKEVDVDVSPFGSAHLIFVDTVKADRTTQQHGIAWRVINRLVGTPGWVAFDQERVLDGRKSEAKRFQVIVTADFLEDSVLPDWTAFDPQSAAWRAARTAVHDAIRDFLATFTAAKRQETKESVRESLADTVVRLPPGGRARWDGFVDAVVDTCPSITPDEIKQVAEVLANLELSTSKYALIGKLQELPPGDLDALHKILEDWTVALAKDALDEIQTRLKLVEELDRKLRSEASDEVRDLQPLLEKSLWVFGPEFESLEFTSNRGMTTVIREIFGAKDQGSLLRPDFVMLPDGSVGLYSRDSYDERHEVSGVARLVIAEIKRPGVPIGSQQKDQAWKYVKELIHRGYVTRLTNVDCFVLGSQIEVAESGERREWDGRVVIQPLLYNAFIRRAEARMLGLRSKLIEAPFLREHGIDGAAFLNQPTPRQGALDLTR